MRHDDKRERIAVNTCRDSKLREFVGVKAVLFDAVGTLIYPDPPVARVYHRVGRRHGSTLSQPQVAWRFRQSLARQDTQANGPRETFATSPSIERQRWRQLVCDVFRDAPDPEPIFDELWQHFAQPTSWALYPDVLPVWNQFRDQGVLVGVASNFDERLNRICCRLEPLRRTKLVFHSAGLGYRKPAIEFFRGVQHSLRMAPEQLLMVGDDRQADYAGAIRAGWHALWLNRQGPSGNADQLTNLRGMPSLIAAG